jgi:hypothetical protein
MPTILPRRPEALKDWVSTVPPELVKKAEEQLLYYEDEFDGTANFFGISNTGNVEVYTERQCHASMSRVDESYRVALATENGRDRSGKDADLCRPFLKWMLYESPYHFIILNRDNFDFCEQHGFVFAGDAPTTYVQANCILSRHFYEVPKESFKAFNEMVERGIDGLIAYNIAFCSNLYAYARPEQRETYNFTGYHGHRVHPAFNPEILVNMIKGDLQQDFGKTYQEAPSIYGCTRLFVPNGNDPYYAGNHEDYALCKYRKKSTAFHNYMLRCEGRGGEEATAEVYRPPNPFAKKVPEKLEHAFNIAQAITVVADYCQQYIEQHTEQVVAS